MHCSAPRDIMSDRLTPVVLVAGARRVGPKMVDRLWMVILLSFSLRDTLGTVTSVSYTHLTLPTIVGV